MERGISTTEEDAPFSRGPFKTSVFSRGFSLKKMETSSQSAAGRGLWNNPRVTQCSKETQDMLKLMKEESRLANIQRKEIDKCPKNRAALPSTSDPTTSSTSSKSVQKQLPVLCQKRSAESCRSGNNYMREKFCPGPTRDLEKEKRRLQNILATGQEEASAASSHKAPSCRDPEVSEEEDRYLEVLNEIEERRQFLADMASLGQEKDYIDIINAEISQKIRELKELDKTHSSK